MHPDWWPLPLQMVIRLCWPNFCGPFRNRTHACRYLKESPQGGFVCVSLDSKEARAVDEFLRKSQVKQWIRCSGPASFDKIEVPE